MAYILIIIIVFKKLLPSCKSVNPYTVSLKMLGLYLYTRIIGHTSCNMLSILNKLKLQKELQIFLTNNVFLDKSRNRTTKNQT